MPTIYAIKTTVESQGSYFFSRDTLRFFGQTLKSFKVKTSPSGRVFIYAPSYGKMTGKRRLVGYTFREFVNDELAMVRDDDGRAVRFESAWEVKAYIAEH